MAEAVYIVNGARTPIGKFLGGLSDLAAPELGAIAIQQVLEKSKLNPEAVDDVYMGCVLTAGIGQAPARQAMLKAGIPASTGATTIGKVCGSGMKAVMLGRSEILAGEAGLVIAGGMESMSQAPYLMKSLRKGSKMGNQVLIDSMITDGLWDPYSDVHMGNCAERCVEKYHFSREALDNFAITSYQRARTALENKMFAAEIAPVPVAQRKGEPLIINTDEEPHNADLSKLTGLRPAFEKTGHITAGNASTLNDGAAAVLLASELQVKQHQLKPMARIVAAATHSQDPMWFTTAPMGAVEKVLQKAGMTLDQIDVFEINEAFAAVALAAIEGLNLDPDKVNIHGGAIALGHPIGASGARLLVTLMHTLQRSGKRYGLATLCIGGGEATAMILENMAVT